MITNVVAFVMLLVRGAWQKSSGGGGGRAKKVLMARSRSQSNSQNRHAGIPKSTTSYGNFYSAILGYKCNCIFVDDASLAVLEELNTSDSIFFSNRFDLRQLTPYSTFLDTQFAEP